MDKGGRPKQMLPEELRRRLQMFMDEVEAGNIAVPSDYRLAKYLGVAPQTVVNWSRDKDRYPKHFAELKVLIPFREDFYLRKAQSNEKNNAFYIFCLKQAKNGGYADKQEKSVDPIRLDVTINGVKDAFR